MDILRIRGRRRLVGVEVGDGHLGRECWWLRGKKKSSDSNEEGSAVESERDGAFSAAKSKEYSE